MKSNIKKPILDKRRISGLRWRAILGFIFVIVPSLFLPWYTTDKLYLAILLGLRIAVPVALTLEATGYLILVEKRIALKALWLFIFLNILLIFVVPLLPIDIFDIFGL